MVTGAVVLLWPAYDIMIGDGGYDVTVHIASELSGIESVTCVPFGDQNQAQEAVRHLFLEAPPNSDVPFSGKPITVGIRSSSRSRNGRELSRFYEKYLVVIAKLHDGSQIGKLVEFSDGAGKVSVTLP